MELNTIHTYYLNTAFGQNILLQWEKYRLNSAFSASQGEQEERQDFVVLGGLTGRRLAAAGRRDATAEVPGEVAGEGGGKGAVGHQAHQETRRRDGHGRQVRF